MYSAMRPKPKPVDIRADHIRQKTVVIDKNMDIDRRQSVGCCETHDSGLWYLVGGAITTLKNIIQWEGLSHVLWKIQNVWNQKTDMGFVFFYTTPQKVGDVASGCWCQTYGANGGISIFPWEKPSVEDFELLCLMTPEATHILKASNSQRWNVECKFDHSSVSQNLEPAEGTIWWHTSGQIQHQIHTPASFHMGITMGNIAIQIWRYPLVNKHVAKLKMAIYSVFSH